jgi:hypothetical protein
MERHETARGYVPLLLASVFGISAGTAIVGRPSPGTNGQATLPTERVVQRSGERSSGDLQGARPALELIAEHLNVGRHDGEASRAARRLAESLVSSGNEEGADAARRLARRLGSSEVGGEEVHDDVAFLGRVPLEKGSPAWEDRARVVKHFDADEADQLLLANVKEKLQSEGIDLRVVIATLPDYVDSYSAWTFDLQLDALQRAAGSARYVLDRYYLPASGSGLAPGSPAPDGPRHGEEPGAVLLRKRGKDGFQGLLLLLLPLETATGGVHQGAFSSAIRLARALRDDGPLPVLGPTFSGSATSLHRALQTALDERLIHPPAEGEPVAVEVVSGSATLRTIQAQIEEGYRCPAGLDCGGLVSFHSTMAPDIEAMRALKAFLGDIDDDWRTGRRMAWLVESNTGWGQGLVRSSGDAKATEKRSVARECSDRELFPCARILPFPLHVSRLRATASSGARAGSKTAALSATVTSLRQDNDSTTYRDQTPAMRPEMTSAIVETSLQMLLATLEHLDITAVGLFGTDDRDKLFLAEQIRRRAPNVLLFTLDGSLAYLHADYRSYARGTVIVSSYPLFPLTQALMPRSAAPTMRLQQFPAVTAQGVYNGLLALLGEPKRMLAYGEDCALDTPDACRPGVWISVVGEDAIWPLRHTELDPSEGSEYSWRPKRSITSASAVEAPPGPAEPSPSDRARARLRWPTSAIFLFVGAGLGLAFHLTVGFAIAWSVASRSRPRARAGRGRLGVLGERVVEVFHRRLPVLVPPDICADRWSVPVDPIRRVRLRQEYWLSLLASGGAILAVVAMTSHLAAVGLNTGADGGPSPLRVALAASLRLILGCSFAAGAAAAFWPTVARIGAAGGPVTVVRGLAVGLGLIALGLLEWGFWAPQWQGPLAGINAHRYALVGNLVSPLVPVLLLSTIVYSWGLWNLWRLHQQAACFGPDSTVAALLAADDPGESAELSRALDSPTLDVRRPAALLLVTLAALQALVGHRFGATPDGQAVGQLIIVGTMLSTLLVGHTLAHCFHLGRRALATLQALDRHPIGEAFARLGRAPFLWKLSDGAPRGNALAPLLRQARALALAVQDQATRLEPTAAAISAGLLPEYPPAIKRLVESVGDTRERSTGDRRAPAPATEIADGASCFLGKVLQIRATDVARLRTLATTAPHAPGDDLSGPLHAMPAWHELEQWSAGFRRALERGPWTRRPFPPPEERGGTPPLDEAETLIALQVSCVLRQLLVRLTKGLTFAAGGLFLVLASHLLYTFQGRTFWLGLDWVLLGLGTLVVLYLFVRLEKDPVLSRIWATRPDRLDWNGGFFRRALVYGAIPVVMLFVTFFPEVGGALFGWLEPFQKSLP